MTMLVGKINAIIGDRSITDDEVLPLETLLFADKIIDGEERSLLDTVLHPSKYEMGPVTMSDATRFRLEAIMGGAFIPERYLQRLRTHPEKITPESLNQLEKKLSQTARRAMKDDLPLVKQIKFIDSRHFELTFQKHGRTLSWSYQNEESFKKVHGLLASAGISFEEALEALEEHGEANHADLEKIDKIEMIFATLYEEHLKKKGKSPLTIAAQFYYNYISPIQTKFDDFTDEKTEGLNPTKNLPAKYAPLFQGLISDPHVLQALIAALKTIPPLALKLLLENGYTFRIVSNSKISHDFYLDHPEINDPMSFEVWGRTSHEKKKIQFSINGDAQVTAYCLAHEIGHALFFILNSMDESVVNLIIFHYFKEIVGLNIKNEKTITQNASLTKTAKLYSESNAWEWFADAFAIMCLGQREIRFKRGRKSFYSGIGAGFRPLLNNLKTRDPKGYQLMARLDHYLMEGRQNPEDALSWFHYVNARDTGDFFRRMDETFPFERDVNLKLMDNLMTRNSRTSLEEVMTQFQKLILSNPFDVQLRKKLAQILAVDGITNSFFYKNPVVTGILDNITRALKEGFPYIPDFFQYRIRFFMAQGAFDKALHEYETAVGTEKNEDTKTDLRKHMIAIYWALEDYPKALEVIKQMPPKNLHTQTIWLLHYLKQKNYEGLLGFLNDLAQDDPKCAAAILLLDQVKPYMDYLKACTIEWETLKETVKLYVFKLDPTKTNHQREALFELFDLRETSLEEIPKSSLY